MCAGLVITMAPRGDMEIALNLVQVQAAVDTAAVGLGAPEPGGLAPAGLPAAHGDDVVDVLFAEPLVVPAGARDGAAVAVAAEAVDALGVDPLAPARGVLLEARGGEDAVAGRVLDVDVQVLALHLDHDVQVDLHAVPDALLDRERVRLLALPPPRQLRPQQYARDDRHDHGPLAAARRARYVLRFRLGYTDPSCTTS